MSQEPACFLCARHFFDFVWCWSPGLTASGALVWGRGCALRRSQGVGFLGFASIRLGFGSVALDFKSGVRRTRLRSWQEFWYLCAAASMNEECWYACQDVGCHVLCVLMYVVAQATDVCLYVCRQAGRHVCVDAIYRMFGCMYMCTYSGTQVCRSVCRYDRYVGMALAPVSALGNRTPVARSTLNRPSRGVQRHKLQSLRLLGLVGFGVYFGRILKLELYCIGSPLRDLTCWILLGSQRRGLGIARSP